MIGVFDTSSGLGLASRDRRPNDVRNPSGVGAVAGTPGTLPTNWSTFTTLTGLTRQIVGVGVEDGIEYTEIKLSGTPSAAGSYYIQFESSVYAVAANSQSWMCSGYFKLSAGSLTGVTTRLLTSARNSSGNDLGGSSTTFVMTSASLASQLQHNSFTNTDALTAYETCYIELVLSGAAIDITTRIGSPRLRRIS